VCGGHGSMKAAALAAAWDAAAQRAFPPVERAKPRCEGCGHPMSNGRLEAEGIAEPGGELMRGLAFDAALKTLRAGQEPTLLAVPWSPCDARCDHDGPGRNPGEPGRLANGPGLFDLSVIKYEAPWRAVDVRPLGWPHDLRPEKLAVLCLRCWAERTST